MLLGGSLLVAVAVFAVSWLVHLVVWRVKRPAAYPIWLPVIFSIVPLLCAVLLWRYAPNMLPVDTVFLGLMFAAPIYAVLSSCYMGGYAGIIEYSPSAEILKAISKRMPKGMPADALEVETLSEEALTGKRVRHLLDSGCAIESHQNMRLTNKGIRFVLLCLFYRRLLCLRGEPKG